jgi:hypothetical protein
MLAFAANTSASWETFRNSADSMQTDRVPDRLVAAESAGSGPPSVERFAVDDSSPSEQTCGAGKDCGSRFLLILLRALSAWTV